MSRLALITGASAGIGVQFARAYAAAGHDLVLTARRKDRLDALAEELRSRHQINVTTISADLALPSAPKEIIDQIEAAGRHVDVLVNNAGYSLPELYEETDWAAQAANIQVLVNAPAELCHRVMPGMRARGFGRIINVASVAGMLPGVARHTVYNASKSFVIRLSQSLNLEAGPGVHVSCICPGLTRTDFQSTARIEKGLAWTPNWMWQKPETVVARAIRGVEQNEPVVTPGFVNQASAVMAKLTPDALVMRLVRGRANFLAPDDLTGASQTLPKH